MNLRLKEVRINSKNTNFKHFITKKMLFSPLIGNIRLSLHTYINSFSSLFVVFFCCRWYIFWFSSIVRIDLNFLERNLYLNKIINAVESHYLPFCFISNTIETIVSPNLDRLNLFVMFLCSLTGLKGFLVIFSVFNWLIHVVEEMSL